MGYSAQVTPQLDTPSVHKVSFGAVEPRETRGAKSMFGMRKKSKAQQEFIGINPNTLQFIKSALEADFQKARRIKFRYRLRFGAIFTTILNPLLVLMQVAFKQDTDNDWAQFPLVIIFPCIVIGVAISVIYFLTDIQKRPQGLAVMCLVGQVAALLDTTTAGSDVSERNVWVHFIFSLGITSSTGLPFMESQFVSFASSAIFIMLSWVHYASADSADELSLSTPGTSTAAVIMYSVLLGFLAWNWEYEERKEFVLTTRLEKENVEVQMTMAMTGWFSGGVDDDKGGQDGVLNKNCHIEARDVEMHEELGVGTFGTVFSATWIQTQVAVKQLDLHGDRMEEIITGFGAEASIMAQLRHPNIVMFLGVMLDGRNGASEATAGLVMELCPKGSVYGLLRQDEYSLDWSLLFRMLLDSARGMNFLHSMSPPIIHRDLKSLNLLVDADWRCKVSDFGLSKLRSQQGGSVISENERVIAGSYHWMAPEIFKGHEHTQASDVYSFGIVLYEILSHSLPYENLSAEAVPFVVQSGKRPTDYVPLPHTNEQLLELAEVMKSCWAQNPHDRPTFGSVMASISVIAAAYVGREPWTENIVYPDRRTNSKDNIELNFYIQEKDLIIGKAIGKGVFGAVYEGTFFGTNVAIKKLFISGVASEMIKEFNKECNIMRNLRHPNIVLFMGSCSNHPNLLLVTELLPQGSFFDIYHQKAQPALRELIALSLGITLDMARGLAYLHNHEPAIIHRYVQIVFSRFLFILFIYFFVEI